MRGLAGGVVPVKIARVLLAAVVLFFKIAGMVWRREGPTVREGLGFYLLWFKLRKDIEASVVAGRAVEAIEAPAERARLFGIAKALMKGHELMSPVEIQARGWSVALLHDAYLDDHLEERLASWLTARGEAWLYGVRVEGIGFSDLNDCPEEVFRAPATVSGIRGLTGKLSGLDALFFPASLALCVCCSHDYISVFAGDRAQVAALLGDDLDEVNRRFLERAKDAELESFCIETAAEYGIVGS